MTETNHIRVGSGKNSQSLIDHGSLSRADRLIGRGIAYRGQRNINRSLHTMGSQRSGNIQEAAAVKVGVGIDALAKLPRLSVAPRSGSFAT